MNSIQIRRYEIEYCEKCIYFRQFYLNPGFIFPREAPCDNRVLKSRWVGEGRECTKLLYEYCIQEEEFIERNE